MQNVRQSRNELRYFEFRQKIVRSNRVWLAVCSDVLRFHVRRQLNVCDDVVYFRIQITRSHFVEYLPFHPSIHICLPLTLFLFLSLSCSCTKVLNSPFVRMLAIARAPIFTPIILQFLFGTMCSTIHISYNLPCGHRAFSFVCTLHDTIERKNIIFIRKKRRRKKNNPKQNRK